MLLTPIPLCPGYHLRFIVTWGADDVGGQILWAGACYNIFLVDMSLKMLWLSRRMVTCQVVCPKDYLARQSARISPTCVLNCAVLAHQATATVFLFSVLEPLDYTMSCLGTVLSVFAGWMASSLSFTMSIPKFGVGGSGAAGSGCCRSMNCLNWLASGDWKYAWRGPLWDAVLVSWAWK